MKNRNLLLGSLFVCSLSLSSYAGNAGNICAPGICTFNSLDSPADTEVFYCDTADDVTVVHFQNHNLSISGFDDNGELTLNGGDVSKLKRYYFKVSADPNRSSNTIKTVTYNLDGKTKCNIGKGGRILPFNGFFKLL